MLWPSLPMVKWERIFHFTPSNLISFWPRIDDRAYSCHSALLLKLKLDSIAFHSGPTCHTPVCPHRLMTWIQTCVRWDGVRPAEIPHIIRMFGSLLAEGKWDSFPRSSLISRGSEQRLYHLANRCCYRFFSSFPSFSSLSLCPAFSPKIQGASEQGQLCVCVSCHFLGEG